MRHDRLMRGVHRLAERCGLAALVRYYTASLQAEHQLDAGSRLLFRIRHAPAYPLLVALLAILSAGTSLYPFGPVIVAATVFAPHRWRGVIVGSTLGAVIGATALTLAIRTAGLEVVDAWFPAVRQNLLWEESNFWIERYGEAALAVIAALPVPQLPAVVLVGLSELNPLAIVLALLVGKAVKYTVYVLGVLLILRAMRHVAEWDEPAAD